MNGRRGDNKGEIGEKNGHNGGYGRLRKVTKKSMIRVTFRNVPKLSITLSNIRTILNQ